MMTMLAQLFSREQREKILDHILGNPSRPYRVREISKEFKVSVGSVSQFLSLLKKSRILKRKGDNFFVDFNNPLSRTIKTVLNISNLDITPLRRIPGLLGVGLYGSWANGTNKEDSDVDIWIKVKKRVGEEIIAKISRQSSKKTKRNVQLLIIDAEKNRLLKKEDPIFYYSLVYGSVVLYGESLTD
jgi:predicted nucleotidyltransferase